ncbi:glycosyltransferase [Roseomonas populi]|uniref:Glycosyltransferase family 2 protein n=1 Tax=Roseomonas populi TaxID=3121582 RepID=A0ABT1X9Y5_9PROT|nr:glycosyltransferase family 2 protein [Roseomonas pecuniae]MCR0984571.1 glycosyltransferase family 2 protein [Roseomonas pecuniae]
MSPACVVCIPARNEAERIPRLLRALAAQEGSAPLRVLVLANNCTDGTAEAARREGAPSLDLRVEEASLPPDRAHAGGARGLAMERGAAWLREAGGAKGVLLSTDADAEPPPHWISANLAAIAAGAEAVGGAIRIAPEPGTAIPDWLIAAQARVARYWEAVRALAHAIDPLPHDPPPRHGDHTGASLAVTLAAFEAAGGVPAIPTGEDNALVTAIERNGGRLRHPPDVWIAVSAREDGRASGGMAGEMRRWREMAETGAPHLLPDAAFWRTLFRRNRALRASWPRGDARIEGADPELLARTARESVNAIAFVKRADPLLPPLEPEWHEISRATQELEAMAR